MKLLRYLFILIFATSCSIGNDSQHSTKQNKIIERLELEGKPYYDQLVATNEYESLLDQIESGDESLIMGAPTLSKWSDASSAMSLKFSLSRAITKKPDQVMSLIPHYFSITDLCTIPYIEESIDVELKHINDSLSALESSSEPNDSHTKCIDVYKKIKNNITKAQSGA